MSDNIKEPISQTIASPENQDDLPPNVEEQSKRVAQAAELLSTNRVWFPNFSPTETLLAKGGLVVLGLGFAGTLILSLLVLILKDAIPAIPIAVVCLVMMICGITCSVGILISHNSSLQPAFVLNSDGELWCAIPEETAPKTQPVFSRVELVTLREQLDGYAKSLSNNEIDQALKIIMAMQKAREGKDTANYDIDKIEDIENYDENEMENTETISFTYYDHKTDQLQELSVERKQWKAFLAWIDEEFAYFKDQQSD